MIKWIEWIEPFGPNNEPVYNRITADVAIATQRDIGLRAIPPYVYVTDQQALDDFITVHWAKTIDERRTTTEMVREFHQTYSVLINDRPTVPSADVRRLRVALIAEELLELAMSSGVLFDYTIGGIIPDAKVDLVEVADAIGDLDYVVAGAAIVYGFPGAAIVEEIHRSNMSKLGADGKVLRRADGKVLKGPNYFKPDIAKLLNLEGDS